MTYYPGVRESLLDTLSNLLVENVATLDSALANVTPTIDCPTSTASQYFIGDFDILPGEATAFPYWVTISKGGRGDGTDQESRLYVSGGIFDNAFYTNIWCYLHPDAWLPTDGGKTGAIAQAQTRERFRARFQEWILNGVVNTYANLAFSLGSQTFNPGTFDSVDQSLIYKVTDGWESKSFGKNGVVQALHFSHSCRIYGAK